MRSRQHRWSTTAACGFEHVTGDAALIDDRVLGRTQNVQGKQRYEQMPGDIMHPLGLGQSGYVGRQRAGKVFLNASMTRASCLGCCGRPLMCEKDSAASRSEMVRSL